MRILSIIPFYHPMEAGAEIFARRVAEHAAAQGHEVHVVTRRVVGGPKRSTSNGVTIHRSSIDRPRNHRQAQSLAFAGAAIPFLATRGIRTCRKYRCDLVHGQVLNGGVAAAVVSRVCGVPMVYSEQQGRLEHYQPLLDNLLGASLERFVYSSASRIHCVSEAAARHVRSRGSKNVVVIPNGVDVTEFAGIERERTGDPVVVSVSRLVPKNGIQVLIAGFVEVLRRFSGCRLWLLGDGPQHDRLVELARVLEVDGSVEFLGSVPHDEVRARLARADVFVRPSLAEGFPLAFLEAMAAGVPVIGTPVGGIEEIIEDGSSGLLVPTNDTGAVGRAIIRILENREMAASLAHRARRFVETRVDWSIVCPRMLDLYRETAGGVDG